MKCLLILDRINIPPTSIVVNGGTGADFLATPDPKEAWTSAIVPVGDSGTIGVDYGSARTLNTVFIGYTNLGPLAFVNIFNGGTAESQPNFIGTFSAVASEVDPQHLFANFPDATARYWRFDIHHGEAAARTISVGVMATGDSFQPTWGHEWGAGRYVGDTGTAERQFGGGFAIDFGVTFSGWTFSLGDLYDAELRRLYGIVKRRGNTRSILVVEDPEATAGLNERLHWGLFTKFDKYERLQPNLSRWAMTVEDWA